MTSRRFEVLSVNISTAKGTTKQPVAEAAIAAQGLAGDAHAGAGNRQVSLLASETIARFGAEAGRSFKPGEFAENITTRGVDLDRVAPLDRFLIGGAVLEVTQIGKACHADGCAIFKEVGRCVMPQAGIFCRVLQPGAIRPGDAGEYAPRPLRIRIVTLSDRASRGDYEDRSGPRARELMAEFFRPKRWHVEFETAVLPDDAERLRRELLAARDAGVDVVVTSGGTGVGPRDITPETVTAVCDKMVPGIMEAIRAKYGAANPHACLSRSVAGVAGTTLIYALPGSPRAVEEYLREILLTLEHVILMVHGLGH
ncbi:MAG: molybdopterin-binding protein [Planctomycetota bacterium]|nr:molybdopterin-binding protein [Planctomycetota bacterium]